ncbi:MAG: M81 family metallopeptidase [Pseudomonadales bacterium]
MRVVVAMMSHETNTFSPVVTDLARFSRGGSEPPAGADAQRIFRGTASCLGGFLQVCEARGAEVVIPIAAGAAPSGPVEDDAFEFMCQRIVAAASDCDAMLLDLHGAMVTRSFDDGEGELLRRIRAVAPDVPIAVSLDMHANLTDAMVSRATVICGYHTYPHVDMDNTAVRAAQILFDAMEGKVRPVMAWGHAPMLPHVMRQGTDDFPNRELQARVRQMEQSQALAVSLFTGFPHADIYDAGLSVVTVADADPAAGEALRDELLDQAWADRAAFVYEVEPLEQSLARAESIAAAPGDGPVVLLDHYDNTASGGTMDTTEVLAAVLARQLQDAAFFAIYDPAAVAAMAAAGVGNEVTLSLGGKLHMPALREQSAPVVVTGQVRLLSEGSFPATVAMSRGLTMSMGRCGVLRVDGLDIVVISRHLEPFDPGCLRSLGIEPTTRRYVILKSRIHYRVGFRDMAKALVECAGRGVCTSDYGELRFEKVRRPIYPLDGVNATRKEW